MRSRFPVQFAIEGGAFVVEAKENPGGEPSSENREEDFPVDERNWEALSRAERLRYAVRQDGTDQAEISTRSGVPVRTLQSYLAGRDMKAEALVQLADALRVRVEWLASGRGPMHADPRTKEASARTADLFGKLDMDRLARAYSAALQALAASGQYQPDARRIMQVTILLYDEASQASK